MLPGRVYTACHGLVALRFDAIGRLCSGIWFFLDICILPVMVWSLFVLMPLVGYVLEYMVLPEHFLYFYSLLFYHSYYSKHHENIPI